MAWYHVEDSESEAKNMWCWRSRTERGLSTATIPFSVWRCGNCRALAVTRKDSQPHGPCGKCKT